MFVPKRLCIAAIFVIAKKWKQPRYLFNRMNNNCISTSLSTANEKGFTKAAHNDMGECHKDSDEWRKPDTRAHVDNSIEIRV